MYRNQYAETERDELDYKQPLPHLGELFSYEMCFIMRRRCGWTIPACAELVGVSRYWYNLMELGKASPERLVEYWSNHAG